MIKQIAHICIGANDLQEAEHFYCAVLGFKRGFDFLKDGKLYGFYAEVGANTFIEIFIQEEPANLERPIVKHLCFEVDNLDETIATIEAKGVQVTGTKQGGDNSWQAWVTDPSGVSIELMQYTDKSSQFTGQPCIVDW